jgi:hypothetical protein
MEPVLRGRPRFSGLSFLVVFASVAIIGANSASADFNVAEDSFCISNAPGYCFAMAAFSRWYYLNRPEDIPLRQALDKKAQTQICRQLQEFYAKNLIKLQADYCSANQSDQSESFKRFATALTMGEPRIVLLMNRGKSGPVLHAVLAYAWVPELRLLKIYDPNYNGMERSLDMERGQYTSLDITYHAICFPEVFHNNAVLARKIENLYHSYLEKRMAGAPIPWRRAASTSSNGRLKAEGYSRGPTR